MNIFITLDYELFFGSSSGSVDNCIIKPTESLLRITEANGIKLNFFVDAGYLFALKKNCNTHPHLVQDFEKISNQIQFLARKGHGIELHVHPHWEDAQYDGEKWIFPMSRYKLSDFDKTESSNIITKYNEILAEISGQSPIAFRAGGWSAQPFSQLKSALLNNGIKIDSSVFANGYSTSSNQSFDFRSVPQFKTQYYFSDDLTQEDQNGDFKEIPISSHNVNPLFFWRLAMTKLMKKSNHRPYGDGLSLNWPKTQLLKMLIWHSHSVVSIDGLKASFLSRAFKQYKYHTSNEGNFVIIGHPKAFTPYSLKKTAQFIERTKDIHKYRIFQKSE